jgi:hypothetical protein
MTLNIALLIKANAAQAKAELASVADRTKLFGTQTRQAGQEARTSATAIAAYEARIAAMEAELRRLIATQGQANDKARQTVPAFNSGAQSVGNMVAQFNDIGVMLAAGQNPLQLAIQQGTQISQGFGGRGAAGAVQLLKEGFMGLINPVNLGTIAIIAGGAALVQWGMSALGAREDTVSFRESVDELKASVQDMDTVAQNYSAQGLQQIIEKYGKIDAALLQMIERQRNFAEAQAMDSARAAITALGEEYGTVIFNIERARAAAGDTNNELGLTKLQAQELRSAMDAAASAQGFEEQAAALGRVNAILALSKVATSEVAGAANEAEDAVRQLAASAPRASWMNAAITGVNGLIGRLQAALGVKNALTATPTAAGVSGSLAQQYAQYGAGRRAGEIAARESLPLYGNNTPALPGSGSGSGTGAGSGGGGGAARAERDAVAELIAKLREEQAVLAELDPVKQQMLRYREQLATATVAERAEVEQLIRMREQEKALDQLGETGASSFIDLLKGVVQGGNAASNAIKKVTNSIIDMGIQALITGKGPLATLFGINGNIFEGGGSGRRGNLFGNLLGGVSSLFGGGGSGTGTLGLPKFANGIVLGAGGGRDDAILARISAGESVINARATARYRPVLERMNAGLPAFADGRIGGASGAGGVGVGGGAQGGNTYVINQYLDGANGDEAVARIAYEATARAIDQYDRQVLPQRVAGISNNPRVRGR